MSGGSVVQGPRVILISGLPGTGKSTLATGLGQRIGAVILSRDQARQRVSGPLRALDRGFTRLSGRYRRGFQEQANRRLGKAVTHELAAGRPVVVEVVADGVIRRRLEKLAAEHGSPVRSIEVTCPDSAEHARRLRCRPGNWNQIVAHMAKSYQPSPTALVINSCTDPGEMVNQAAQFVCRDS